MRYAMFLSSLIILFLLMPIGSFADEYEDVVYLRNGSVIHGVIIEQISCINVKIETETGDLWVFSYNEIDKVTKENIGDTSIIDTKKQKTPGKINRFGFLGYSKTGYLFHMGYGGGGGIFTFGGVSGVGLGPVFLGGGAEFGFGYGRWKEIRFFPIYGETKFFFMPKSQFTPTGYFDLGVQISGLPDGWFSDEHGNYFYFEGPSTTGFLIGGGGGIEYRVLPHLGFDFSFGYRGFKWFEDWCNHVGFTGGISY